MPRSLPAGSVAAAAVNPLAPSRAFAHAPELLLVAPWRGPWERTHLTDWLGVRTRYGLDCTNDYGYMAFVPSRRVPCVEHAARLANETEGAPPLVVDGYMPLVDDEYPEWVDLIDAATRAALRERACRDGNGGGPSSRCPAHAFVVVELGARYGTWGVRGLALWRALCAPGRARFVGVDSDAKYVGAMHWHVADNGFAADSFAGLHGMCDVLDEPPPKPPEPPVLGLADVMRLGGVEHIDYLDLDIQGSERSYFTSAAVRALMDASVAHVHVGTHSADMHVTLAHMFEVEWGWERTMDLSSAYSGNKSVYEVCDETVVNGLQTNLSLCSEDTPWGPVYVRDGLLGFRNPSPHFDAL